MKRELREMAEEDHEGQVLKKGQHSYLFPDFNYGPFCTSGHETREPWTLCPRPPGWRHSPGVGKPRELRAAPPWSPADSREQVCGPAADPAQRAVSEVRKK